MIVEAGQPSNRGAIKGAPIRVRAIPVVQGTATYYLLTLPASKLWRMLQINRRVEDKREGYQRTLSQSRVRAISKYIQNGGNIPGVIIVSFDLGEYDIDTNEIVMARDYNVGWVIDGQHRLAGAYEAINENLDPQLSVAAYLGAPIDKQIEMFVTINREAHGVPASLYIDLLADLPRKKTDKEITEERVTDIARRLSTNENSRFFQRLIFTRTARAGEISLVNFARIFRPLITRPSGHLALYTQPEQEGVIDNYYKALFQSFPQAAKKEIFFRTVGFGAVWRAFPLVFNIANSRYGAVSVSAFSKVFAEIADFDFESWTQAGSGSGAEIQAGDDLITAIQRTLESDQSPTLALRLE